MTTVGRQLRDNAVALISLVDRKSTRLNSSHGYISYAVFCLKKKINRPEEVDQVDLLRGAFPDGRRRRREPTACRHGPRSPGERSHRLLFVMSNGPGARAWCL